MFAWEIPFETYSTDVLAMLCRRLGGKSKDSSPDKKESG